jgi:D-beta-D-heptose 7-phosphate kinase/D-beta-D-heptose 1-phosphate adenosyltransferase
MDLLPVLKRFGQQRVLVIGDLILDCFIWGKVTRISPEAPVPVVDVQSNTFALGGGANVANNIVALGGQATVLGVVGSDWAAGTMEEIFKDKGIDFVAVEGRRPTTVKTRVIAHSQQVVRFDQEKRDKLSARSLKSLVGFIEDMVPEHDAVLISDYSKGVVTGEVVRSVIRASKGKKFIAVDPKVGHFHLYKGVSLVTPNLMEASQGAGVEITDEKTLIRAGSRLLKKLGCKAVLLTRGEEGMSLFQDGSVIHIPTLARKVFDVTGAGDTVIAAFALAHAARASMEEAAVISNHAAGIVVGEVGTATATQARIRQSIRQSKLKIEKQAIGG